MGSRTMPTFCPHGVCLDWGDFGPDEGPNGDECSQCEMDRRRDHAEMMTEVERIIGCALARELGHTMLAPFADKPQPAPNTLRIAGWVIRALQDEGYSFLFLGGQDTPPAERSGSE